MHVVSHKPGALGSLGMHLSLPPVGAALEAEANHGESYSH